MTFANRLFGAGTLLFLTSCAGLSTTSVPDTAFATGETVQSAIAAYYEDHATEYDVGPCYRPYFDAITKVDVVEQDADHLVVDMRYSYRDRLRDDEDTGSRILPNSRRVCWGFESRQFTLAKENGGVEVIEMSGSTRSDGTPTPGSVTLGGQLRLGIGSGLAFGS